MSLLEVLYLDGNLLTGPIPDFASAKALKSLYLFNNRFTGTIHRSFGSLVNLTNLQLNDNLLTGTLPTELGLMSSLVSLHVNNNTYLHGSIPTDLEALPNLSSAHFHGNHFVGEMPLCQNGTSSSTLLSLTSDCNSVVSCGCCTQCYT
jgi:Leucine-rich repeat (LRR) protein